MPGRYSCPRNVGSEFVRKARGKLSLTVLRVYLSKSYSAIGGRLVGRLILPLGDGRSRRVDTMAGGERLAEEGGW